MKVSLPSLSATLTHNFGMSILPRQMPSLETTLFPERWTLLEVIFLSHTEACTQFSLVTTQTTHTQSFHKRKDSSSCSTLKTVSLGTTICKTSLLTTLKTTTSRALPGSICKPPSHPSSKKLTPNPAPKWIQFFPWLTTKHGFMMSVLTQLALWTSLIQWPPLLSISQMITLMMVIPPATTRSTTTLLLHKELFSCRLSWITWTLPLK